MKYNQGIEAWRDHQYPQLKDKVYLDHAGATVPNRSALEKLNESIFNNLYGNPHSASAPAKLSGEVVDFVREQTLKFFRADPEHFDLIFVANATAAIKLVAESFQDLAAKSTPGKNFWYGYHRDAHTSVVGVRELTNGTHRCFASDEEVEDWLDGFGVDEDNVNGLPGLFAYPGQSNMTGRRLPLDWIRQLRQSNLPQHQNTYSLLDAAALATTTQLDLSDPDAAADFTAVSFYKIFGSPHIGALIVRKDSGHILSWRKYFGGGTVDSVTVIHEATVQRKQSTIHDGLEDGTLPFLSILNLGIAIDVHLDLFTSMHCISQHTSFLSFRLYQGMTSLYHGNGTPVCHIYNEGPDKSVYGDALTQGATIAFNVLHSDGTYVGHSQVEALANARQIYLRSGGLCNSGGISTYLQVEPWQFKRNWSAGHRCGDAKLEILHGKPTGVVRVSLGAMTTLGEIEKFLEFLEVVFLEVDIPSVDDQHSLNLDLEVKTSNDSGFQGSMPDTSKVQTQSLPTTTPPMRRIASTPSIPGAPKKPLVPKRSFYDHHARPGVIAHHPSEGALSTIGVQASNGPKSNGIKYTDSRFPDNGARKTGISTNSSSSTGVSDIKVPSDTPGRPGTGVKPSAGLGIKLGGRKVAKAVNADLNGLSSTQPDPEELRQAARDILRYEADRKARRSGQTERSSSRGNPQSSSDEVGVLEEKTTQKETRKRASFMNWFRSRKERERVNGN